MYTPAPRVYRPPSLHTGAVDVQSRVRGMSARLRQESERERMRLQVSIGSDLSPKDNFVALRELPQKRQWYRM